MIFNSLRDYLEALRSKGELIDIHVEVDSHLEITEIADRCFKSHPQSPTLVFHNVKGYQMPVVINLYGTEKRTAFALGVNHLNDFADRIRTLTNLAPPKTLKAKITKALQLLEIRKWTPKYVKKAPVHEIVITGNDVDLTKLPILTCWPDDGGKFITLTAVVSKDPDLDARNIGMYRVQVFDKNTTGLHWQRHKGGAAHHEKFKKSGGKMEVAVVMGGDPTTIYSASAPLPPNIDEWMFSGFMRKKSVELVKCKTVDLEVPAHAEIVLEGYVDLNEPLRVEGPFGDHTGFYSLADNYPAFHVTAITMRKDAIYPTTIVGIPPVEDVWLGKITERAFLPLMNVVLPEVRDYHMPSEGVFHNLVIAAARKNYPGHGWKMIHGMLGLGLMMLTKVLILLDEAKDVENIPETWRELMKHADFGLDVVLSRGPIDALDHSSQFFTYSGKLLIDATTKWDGEGRVSAKLPEGSKETVLAQKERLRKLIENEKEVLSWSLPYHLPEDKLPLSPLFIEIKKDEAGKGQKVAKKILSWDVGEWNKLVIILDDVRNIQSAFECWWIALNNLDPMRDVIFHNVKNESSEYEVPGYEKGVVRMGWDGTTKLPSEGFTRDWPWKVVMPDEIKTKVTQRWADYGLSNP